MVSVQLDSRGEAKVLSQNERNIKMNAFFKNRIAMQIANNAYNGHGSSVKQIVACLDFDFDAVNEVVSELVRSGKVELRTVLAGNPFTGSQRSEVHCLPVIDGKGRSFADRHMFSRKVYINSVTRCELV